MSDTEHPGRTDMKTGLLAAAAGALLVSAWLTRPK
jgi:hypothetical protein